MPGPGHTVNLPSEIRESSRLKRRFWWSANVPITNDPLPMWSRRPTG